VPQPSVEEIQQISKMAIVQPTSELSPPEADGSQNLCIPVMTTTAQQQTMKLLDLGGDIPEDMDDQLPPGMQRRLEKCHLEGFIECVKEHVTSLTNGKIRK